MSKLHSNVKAHKLPATKRIVEQAFDGRQFETIWEEFDSTPLGIGAIAQVIPLSTSAHELGIQSQSQPLPRSPILSLWISPT
jgi:aarF domain-containing kinase